MSTQDEEHQQNLIDAARDTNFALWNALLTLDGVIISVFSAVAIFDAKSKAFVIALVVLSLLSAIFLVQNFRSAQYVYNLLGSISPAQLTDDVIRKSYADVRKKRIWSERRERLCFWIFGLDAIIVVILVSLKNA